MTVQLTPEAQRSSDLKPPRDRGGEEAASVNYLLSTWAEYLSDIEKARIAMGNRLGAMQREGASERYTLRLELAHEWAQDMEKHAEEELQRNMRLHPLSGFVKEMKGVGLKQGARLIAAIGDVTYNHAEGRPRRGVAEFWAYCGFVPGQRRRKGVQSNWNAEAKMRVILVASKCVEMNGVPDKNGRRRARSPYRDVYDRARAAWEGRDTTDKHKHNHAVRLAAKEILKDLFLYAKELEQA